MNDIFRNIFEGLLLGLVSLFLLYLMVLCIPDLPARVSDDEWQRIVYRCSDPQLDPDSQSWCHQFLGSGGKYE